MGDKGVNNEKEERDNRFDGEDAKMLLKIIVITLAVIIVAYAVAMILVLPR